MIQNKLFKENFKIRLKNPSKKMNKISFFNRTIKIQTYHK